jgi:hypothetical protein
MVVYNSGDNNNNNADDEYEDKSLRKNKGNNGTYLKNNGY